MTASLAFNVVYGLVLFVLICLACKGSTLMERARCSAIVAGRICAGHWPKRDLETRLQDPCTYCDRAAECLDHIEAGTPAKGGK